LKKLYIYIYIIYIRTYVYAYVYTHIVHTYIHTYICVYVHSMGIKRRILLRHFCYLLRTALGDDATKVMVLQRPSNPSRYVTPGIYGQSWRRLFIIFCPELCRTHAHAGAARREESGSEAVERWGRR